MKTGIWISGILLVALTLIPTGAAGSFVPQPIDEAPLNVEVGKVYAFPWIGPVRCLDLTPGCFRVDRIDRKRIQLAFGRFFIKEGKIHANGFFAKVLIGRDGTDGALYAIEGTPPSQTWVYAAYSGPVEDRARIRFFKIPAFVTKKARIYRAMLLDFPARSLWEKTRVEAEKPVTLISSGAVEKAIRNSSLAAIKVNGKKPRFFLPSMINLNFPPGTNDIETMISWQEEKTRVCPWSVYEGRKMSLPVETELTIKNSARDRLALSVSSLGLPQKVWEDTEVILARSSTYEILEEKKLSKTLRFPPAEELRITLKPVIVYQGYSFPVIVCVDRVKNL
ncbi:MAG: hypothetical protein ACE5JU_17630 [Candidatus Binatia bacterium]